MEASVCVDGVRMKFDNESGVTDLLLNVVLSGNFQRENIF